MATRGMLEDFAALWRSVGEFSELTQRVNYKVVWVTSLLHVTLATLYYFRVFGRQYMRWAYGRKNMPWIPFTIVLASFASILPLVFTVNVLVLKLGVSSIPQALQLAAVLWLIDTCLNVRHHLFESKPFGLWLLHCGYSAVTLSMSCVIAAHTLGGGLNCSES